MMHLFRIRKI